MTLFSQPFDELGTGDRFTTRGRTVTEADVAAFSGLTWDHHPQHTDEEWSATRPFGGRIAHGMLVLSFAAGLVPFDPERVIALRRVRDVVFKRPVRFGDTIQVQGKVAEVKPVDPSAGLVSVALNVTGAGGQTVMRATVEVLWKRDAEQGEDAGDGAAASAGEPADALTCVPL
jgi:3-hydroxybutyryl-CoA dehydratase